MHRRIVSSIATLIVAMGAAASSQAQDPLIGTWVLDVPRSTYRVAKPPQSQVITFSSHTQAVQVLIETVDAGGNRQTTRYTASYDGHDYPVTGSSQVDTASEVRVDRFTTVRTDKKSGKLVRALTRVVAPDGRTMTVTTRAFDRHGRDAVSVAVYTKRGR